MLTIIDSLSIGIPSFFLALATNPRRYRPGFAGRVLQFAIPAGAIVAAVVFAADVLSRAQGLPLAQQRTASTLVTLSLSLCVLALLALPLTWRRALLVGAMAAGFVLLFLLAAVRHFYELEIPHGYLGIIMLTAVAGAAGLTGFWLAFGRRVRGQAPPGNQ